MIKSLFLILLTLTFFTACIPSLSPNLQNATDFKDITSELTTSSFCSKLKKDDTIYVTDFVNQKDFHNKSELGFVLSNALKVNILRDSCNKTVQIKAFNLAENLTVSPSGIKMLSYSFHDMKTKSIQDDKQVVIGTYTITSSQLILFLKLIDIKSGNTISSSQTSHFINDEILELDGRESLIQQPYIFKPFHL